jgi:hypothetical protein
MLGMRDFFFEVVETQPKVSVTFVKDKPQAFKAWAANEFLDLPALSQESTQWTVSEMERTPASGERGR